jgi:hypothetical protein
MRQPRIVSHRLTLKKSWNNPGFFKYKNLGLLISYGIAAQSSLGKVSQEFP